MIGQPVRTFLTDATLASHEWIGPVDQPEQNEGKRKRGKKSAVQEVVLCPEVQLFLPTEEPGEVRVELIHCFFPGHFQWLI